MSPVGDRVREGAKRPEMLLKKFLGPFHRTRPAQPDETTIRFVVDGVPRVIKTTVFDVGSNEWTVNF